MKLAKTVAGIALATTILSGAGTAKADAPADDFLNPQEPGSRLGFMTIFGPGFRVVYDNRIELEEEVTELRTQLIGDVVIPYSEIGAHIDLRMFLFSIGGSVGYHNEFHLLQFQPDYNLQTAGYGAGRDRPERVVLGQLPDNTNPDIGADGFGFTDLDREARRVKDQVADIQSERWPFYEGRVQFLWPAQNFMGVSTAAIRLEDRPDVSYDWANATVMNGGWHLRWETYAFFRHREYGFIGPALRIMNMPRNRLQGDIQVDPGFGPAVTAPSGSACQPGTGTLPSGEPFRVPCKEVRETDFHYGFVGGFRPNWAGASDVFLTRVYMSFGLDDELFGTHIFGMPISLLFAYQVDLDL